MAPRGATDTTGAAQRPRLRVVFEGQEVFREEYARNIANGGIFVPTRQSFEPRQLVELEVDLAFQGERFLLEGEVVAQVLDGRPGPPTHETESGAPSARLRASERPEASPRGEPSRSAAPER
jgi:hypothetical protein